VRFVVLIVLILGILGASESAGAAVGRGRGTSLGAYVQPEDWSRGGQKASVNGLERDLGRTLDIDHLFFKWDGNAFPNWRQRWDRRHGRVPMISWAGTYLDGVLDGTHDALIRNRALGLKRLRSPVLLRWFGEMDAVIYENDEISSPDQFVDAWRYMHDMFDDVGATNVDWVWCPNASSFASGRAQLFYPGNAYVDWICADGYNWAPDRENASWTSFKDIFSSFYTWGEPKPRPLMVGETGVLENDPGDKADWITKMGRTLQRSYPAIKALVYMDAYTTANFGGWYDWRLDTSESSYQAFIDVANRRFFN